MSIPLMTKSDDDISSNSSWSIISESEDSEFISEGNNTILKCDSDNKNNDIDETEDNFFDICEGNSHELIESENEDINTEFVCFKQVAKAAKQTPLNKPKQVKPKSKKPKKYRTKEKAETLSLFSIAASVLTITGLTFLCMLFPQNLEKEAIQNVQKSYIDIITSKNVSAENFLNKTADIYDVVNKADFFNKVKDTLNENDYFMSEEICPVDEANNEDFNFDRYRIGFGTSPTSELDKPNLEPKTAASTPYQQVQNKTLGLIKNVKRILMDPNLQIFVCTVLQDICLIKLVNQLNKQQVEKSTDGEEICPEKISVRSSKKKNGAKISNLKSKQTFKMNKKSNKNSTIKNSSEDSVPAFNASKALGEELNNVSTVKLHSRNEKDKENGKSECERRFEELDNKWEAAGHFHRKKIQEIKENFKNEICHIKENEKEHSLRRQRIQLLREKYIERLRMDREKYLYKLQKLREERHRIMERLCQKKSNEIDLRDASVGNYAVLLPDSYSFQQKLQFLKNQDRDTRISLPSIPTASYPKLGAVKNNKFLKFQSIPNIPKQAIPKLNVGAATESIHAKQQKYLEKVKQYYEKKNNYLQKKALVNKEEIKESDFTSKAATIGQALIEDILSHMVVNIQEPGNKLHENSSNSSVETVKANESSNYEIMSSDAVNMSDVTPQNQKGNINPDFKLVAKRKPKKKDWYEMAFDAKGKKVKQEDMIKWHLERKERLHRLQQHQMLTKQDPQKAFKEKIIIRGHI